MEPLVVSFEWVHHAAFIQIQLQVMMVLTIVQLMQVWLEMTVWYTCIYGSACSNYSRDYSFIPQTDTSSNKAKNLSQQESGDSVL